jgi:CheY-like chemotaxis protein
VLVNRIINQSRLARRLVDNLLDLNRIEEGKLLPTPSFFRLRDLISTCAEDEVPLLQARGVKLITSLPSEDLLCFGDREMIAQVVRNVMGNAIKFTRSQVTLETRALDSSGNAGGTIELMVSDDGPGVPAEDLPHIFDKYRKSDMRALGSGLGLFISRKMVELHHGKIAATSEPGKGARFTITLPHVVPASMLPDLSELTDGRVLVVSASKPNALLLEGVLIEAGLVHVTKDWPADAESPLEFPQLVIVDAQAPHAERLIQVVRQAKSRKAAPAWLVVGSAEEAKDIGRWLDGAPERLDAPINPLTYLRRVQALLSRAGTASEQVGAPLQRALRG